MCLSCRDGEPRNPHLRHRGGELSIMSPIYCLMQPVSSGQRHRVDRLGRGRFHDVSEVAGIQCASLTFRESADPRASTKPLYLPRRSCARSNSNSSSGDGERKRKKRGKTSGTSMSAAPATKFVNTFARTAMGKQNNTLHGPSTFTRVPVPSPQRRKSMLTKASSEANTSRTWSGHGRRKVRAR